MRTIGLLRHFEVIQDQPKKTWMTSNEFDTWLKAYDHCDVIRTQSSINSSDWDMCISSDLTRAVITSKDMYNKEIIFTEQLREIQMKSLFNTNVRLHYHIWLIIGRIAWSIINKSKPGGKHEIIERVRNLFDQLEQQNATKLLVVSHGGLMWYLRKELRKRRFNGPIFIKPKNGKLYTFHKY